MGRAVHVLEGVCMCMRSDMLKLNDILESNTNKSCNKMQKRRKNITLLVFLKFNYVNVKVHSFSCATLFSKTT